MRKAMTMNTHDTCASVPFAAGQVLIHEEDGHAIVEIHAKLGWRIKGLCDPTRVGENKGRGSMDRGVRIFLCYSERQRTADRWKMEETGAGRAEPLMKITERRSG